MASRAQMTPLLGVCDGHLDPERYRTSFLTNKVGGRPDWLPGLPSPPPRCALCGAPLAHVVQVYCPLQDSPYHRDLHLFACTGAGCGGRSESWRVLRSQSLEEEAAAGAPGRPDPAREAPLAATDWCDSAEDWGLEEEEDGGWGGAVTEQEEVNTALTQREASAPQVPAPCQTDVSAQLQDLSLGEPQGAVPVLRSFFISVVEESDLGGGEDDLRHAQQLLREYEKREGVAVGELEGGEGGGGGEEKYEKTTAHHGDAVFSRFMKRISVCPQQILRYCRGGEPIFISQPPANMAQVVTACSRCGGARTFELQLMPALVSLLQGVEGAESELEFGTVLVYTCAKSCWTTESRSAVEELCFVQTDPDQQLFR